jgi:hypothetical protein
MISYDILIKSFVTIKNPALMVDIGVLSLAAMDHGPKKKSCLIGPFSSKNGNQMDNEMGLCGRV